MLNRQELYDKSPICCESGAEDIIGGADDLKKGVKVFQLLKTINSSLPFEIICEKHNLPRYAILEPMKGIEGRPANMPDIQNGNKVFCGYNQGGLGEKIFICNSLFGMQMLYDKFIGGHATEINWYLGLDPRQHQGDTADIVDKIIN